MIFSVTKSQRSATVLTVRDTFMYAQILFSHDQPVAMLYQDGEKVKVAVLDRKQRQRRRSMDLHIAYWLPKGIRVREMGFVDFDKALRRVLSLIDPPDSPSFFELSLEKGK